MHVINNFSVWSSDVIKMDETPGTYDSPFLRKNKTYFKRE